MATDVQTPRPPQTANERAIQRRENRRSQRRRRAARVLIALGLAGLAVAALMVTRQLRAYGTARNEYQALREGFVSKAQPLAPAGEESAAPEVPANVDVAALRLLNPDCVGWVEVPGADIAYPVVQGADNDYYLNHTFEGVANNAGAIFMDCRGDPAFGDESAILYGHNMRDGSMFSGLGSYLDGDFLRENTALYIHTESDILVYRILLAATVPGDDALYALGGQSAARLRALLEEAGADYPENGPFLTLSTCTDGGGAEQRNIVVAALAGGTAPK